MEFKKKIINLAALVDKATLAKEQNQRVVLCHGHFNVLHPGHLRFIQYAHEQGDRLLVAVLGHKLLTEEEKKRYFTQDERAEGVASLQNVDWVVVLDEISMEEVIEIVNPSVYVLGKEFENSYNEKIKTYVKQVKANKGKVVFSSGEVHYASADFLYFPQKEIEHGKIAKFLVTCKRNNIKKATLSKYINKFSRLKLAVIGDTIIDQYVACDALGMSAEAPIIAVKELEAKEFLGGASIVACHLASLGTQCHFFSVIGDDKAGNFAQNGLKNQGVNAELFIENGRPTTFKIRYIVNNQKLFRVSRLQEHSIPKNIESQIIKKLKKLASELDGIVISDFVYGVITPSLLSSVTEIAKKHNIKLFGDLQCSSQVGNILKFKHFNFLCPTERETRIALSDHEEGLEKLARKVLEQTKAENLLITLGADGFVAYHTENKNNSVQSQHFTALISNPIDVVGAGDSLLSAMSVSLCAGANLMESSAIGAFAAAIAVSRVGNVSISAEDLNQYINGIFAANFNNLPAHKDTRYRSNTQT